jgi:hypothetical protein
MYLDITEVSEQVEVFANLIEVLPAAHKTALQYTITFLHELSEHSEKNKMNTQNISKGIPYCYSDPNRYCFWSNIDAISRPGRFLVRCSIQVGGSGSIHVGTFSRAV